ncbi:ATP-binding protein, partial [Micromonospora ureilytica]
PTLATPPVDGREEGAATSDEPWDELDGLPRRVRRRTPAAQPRSTVTDTPSPRSPEEVRQVMAALQAGTARGRATASTPTAPPAGTGPAVPTDPPTIPEPPTVTERDA